MSVRWGVEGRVPKSMFRVIIYNMTKAKPDGNLTFDQKAEILKYRAQNPKIPYTKIAEWAQEKFNLSRRPAKSTISHTVNDPDKFL